MSTLSAYSQQEKYIVPAELAIVFKNHMREKNRPIMSGFILDDKVIFLVGPVLRRAKDSSEKVLDNVKERENSALTEALISCMH